MSDIGKKIADRRRLLGLTLEEVGDAVGVSKTTVQRWENGNIKSIGSNKVSALARVLNLPTTELVPPEKPDLVRLEVKGSAPRRLFATDAMPKKKELAGIEYGLQDVKGVVVDKQFAQVKKLWLEASPESKRLAIEVLKVGKGK